MKKRIKYFIIALLSAVLLPQPAVQAAEEGAVLLTEENGKAALEIEIPDSSEGITTFRLRVRIEEATENLDPEEPLKFETGENVQPELIETRYDAEKGYFTVYVSSTDKITDKSRFTAGYFVPNTKDSTPGSITISVPQDGLQYVDGAGQLNDKMDIQPSTLVLNMNQSAGGPEENPGGADSGETDGADDGSAGGVTDGTESGAQGGSTEGTGGSTGGSAGSAGEAAGGISGETAGESSQGVSESTGEVFMAAQTGDNTNPLLLCAIAGLSAFAVISALVIRRAGKSCKKSRNRK